MSFLSSSGTTLAASAFEPGSTYRKFVIYYGWYSDSDGRPGHDIDRIIKTKPEYIISPYYTSSGSVNLRPEIIKKFHDNGIKVIVYVATGNANRNLENVLTEMKTAFDSRVDGVMLDEVAMLHSQQQVDYYKTIYDFAKFYGGKLVIANPGSIVVSEKVMSVSDIVSFEHQWRLAPHIDWFSKYPAIRFMGVSSNDIPGVMGYAVNSETALRDTIEAWQSGVAYHFSTDRYTSLPSWFEDYQKALNDYSTEAARLHEVRIKTVDTDGREINGLWIEVRKNDRLIITGFSPAKFMLPQGHYQIGAANYQNFIFSRWQDGETVAYRKVPVDGPTELTAVYKNNLVDLRIETFDQLGNSIKGVKVTVSKDGKTVADGVTPLSLSLPLGKYTVTAPTYRYYEFTRWDNNSTANTRQIDLTGDTQVAAYYSNTLASKIYNKVLSGVCHDPQYEQRVADSMLKYGPIAGLLELHMQRSFKAITGCAAGGG